MTNLSYIVFCNFCFLKGNEASFVCLSAKPWSWLAHRCEACTSQETIPFEYTFLLVLFPDWSTCQPLSYNGRTSEDLYGIFFPSLMWASLVVWGSLYFLGKRTIHAIPESIYHVLILSFLIPDDKSPFGELVEIYLGSLGGGPSFEEFLFP